jgi:predicted tellurium resistance membrane protein TerC
LIEELIILTKIIFITIILTADNAVIVGSIAANFVPKNRKQIILWGVAGAFVFKIFFAIFATYLFKFYFIKILGGLLLIWIVNDLRKDLVDIKRVKSQPKKTKEPSYISSIGKVLFADIMISFDNVIGVVAAAKEYFGFNRGFSDIYGKLYSKAHLDSLHGTNIHFNCWPSINNWWVS